MPNFGIFLLVNVFGAALPPVDPDEETYYEILVVDKKATNDDIRKAYKKLSLRLHPDKLAQSGADEETKKKAAETYERVQEAYAVLVNDEKREKYDQLGMSGTRYQFYERGAVASPGAVYENLTSASFTDKTKLVGFTTSLIILVLLQPILVAAKINQSLEQNGALQDASWVSIFVPTWIFYGMFIIFNLALIKFVPPSQRLPMIVWCMELILWFLGLMFLCLRWDGTWTSPYSQVLTPVYIAFVFHLFGKVLVLQRIREDVQKMVTASFLETNILKGRTLDDLSEEELVVLKREYLVISVPDDFEPTQPEDGVELDEAKIEEQKVEASAEFEAATEIYNETFTMLVGLTILGTIFLILLTRKLDRKMNGSWWLVFLPIWLWLCSRLVLNFYRCICGTVTGSDEILLHMKDMADDAKNENGANEQGEDKNDNDNGNANKGIEGSDDVEKLSKGGTSSDTETESLKEKPASEKSNPIQPGNTTDNIDDPDSKFETVDIEEGTKKNDDDADADAEYIHIDEETFKAWQSAYEQAEETAMQEQAKACTDCCNLTLQVTLLCLIVAKIEKNWDNTDPNDTGFNVFWILFPFFLFFGIICCCCACLIYGAAPGSAEDLQDGNDGDDDDVENDGVAEEEDEQQQQLQPNDEESAVPSSNEVDDHEEGETVDKHAKPGEDPTSTEMDDLD